MKYRYRHLLDKFQKYLNYVPVIVLNGARQVGKTTFLKHNFESSHEIITFDPITDIENARSEPELFFKNHPGPLILDEIQYAPELVPVIKRLVDKEKIPGKFILTGSQQWQVLRNVAESLAGRAIILEMPGFSLSECAKSDKQPSWIEALLSSDSPNLIGADSMALPFPISEHLFRGQLPDAQELPLEVISDFHASYLQTYVERDVRLLAEIGDYSLFGRFYRLCAALSAQEINFSQLGRDIGVTPQTAKRWLDILKSTFQWWEIPAYSGNAIKRISNKPKGYLSDSGLLCYSLFLSGPQALSSHPNWGNIVESLIANELKKNFSVMKSPPTLYHWRSHSGAEVDLILERDGCFWPIEIKSTTRPGKKDTRGIRAFRETYPELNINTGVVIHLGDSNLWLSDKDIAVSYFTG